MLRWWLERLWAPEGSGQGGELPSGGGIGGAVPAPAQAQPQPPVSDVERMVDPPSPKASDGVPDDIWKEWDKATKGLEPVDTGIEPPAAASPEPAKPGEAPKQVAPTGKDPAAPAAPQPAAPLKTPPSPPPVAPSQPQAAQPDANTAALMQQVAALQQQIAAMAQQQPQSQQPASPAAQQAQRYALTMNPQLMEQLRDENPAVAQRAYESMANGLAETVHRTTMAEVRQVLQQEFGPQLVGHIQQTQATQERAQGFRQSFYGAHKDLDHPMLHPVVMNVAAQVFRERGPHPTPETMAAIADRVRSTVHGFAGTPTPPVGVTPQAATYSGGAARPAGVQPNGAPAGPNSPQAVNDFFHSVLR